MQQGGQIGLECLTVEEMFIIGQMIRECVGAESGAVPLTLHNNLSTGLTSYPQGVGVCITCGKPFPQVLRTTAG